MSARDFGAVVDASVLTRREDIERARELFSDGSLYMPAATYSWLSRDKLICIRGLPIGYSLVSQYVRCRGIYGVHLPELYDEIGRRLMFEVNRRVGLTELRTLLLAAHMRLPLLTFETGLIGHLEERLRARELWELESHADPEAIGEVIELYRKLQTDAGIILSQSIEKESSGKPLEEVRRRNGADLRATVEAVERMSRGKTNPGKLKFRCLAWDIKPVAQEYSRQRVLQPDTVRELCERSLLLVANPVG